MTASTKGFLSLAFWLIVGIGFTELASLTLNAWVMHGASKHTTEAPSTLQPEPAHE